MTLYNVDWLYKCGLIVIDKDLPNAYYNYIIYNYWGIIKSIIVNNISE